MNPYLYGVRLPLFLEGDEVPQSEQIITIEQLDAQTITIPVSYTLLEVIQNATPKNGAGKHINALLDEIIKSPSFFFPDVPLVFERQGLLSFVPDDNQEHLLNWRSIILQAHISFLSAIGWENISRIKKSNSGMVDSNDRIDHNRPGVTFNSRAVGSRANYTTGSISVRSQSKCVASFTNRSFGIGSIPTPSFDEIQYTVAPQLDREQEESKDISQLNLELNQLFDFQLQTSFEAVLFKALVLTINSRGIFDKALGNVILSELRDDISNAGFQVGRIVDASQAFDEYYHSLQRTLLTPEAEQEIRDLIGRDDINPILKRFDQLYPFRCVPHAYYFIKSVLAPLCYHENSMIAQLATKQLMTLFNYHDWELHSTKVITADNQIEFERSNEHIILISGPSPYGNNFSTLVGNTTSFLPSAGGFYDFCYARVSSIGELEIDQTMPCGRYIVLPAGARKEIIHELPAFDDKTFISFSDLAANLETLANSGATAVHVTGVIERNFLHDLTSVTDHGVFSKKCGGLTEFKEFCERAKSFGLRVLIDFTPLVCLRNSSKKYAPFATLTADERGRLTTADIPETEMMLLNYRSLPFWDLLSEEILHILDSCGISGFYLGSIEHWDTVLPRDLTELMRLDPDDNQHYNINNIIEGAIVSTTSNENCNLTSRKVEYSPHLYHIMRKIWSKRPDAFVWVQCEPEQEPFVIKSGLIPANYQFRNVLQCAIEYCVPNDNVDYVNANENLIKLYEERSKRNPLGALHICPFGALMDGPYNLPNEGISLAIDALFYLTEVPLISGCLGTAMFYANAYSTIKQVREKNAKRPIKWWPPTQRFTDHLKNRSSTRMKADWALGGDVKILPVSYDSHPMRAILSAVRVCPKTKRSCLICTSYYMYNLIYEVSVNDLTIFDDKPLDSVVEVKPILGAAGQTTYYSINELKGSGSALFLELGKFSTAVYEISIITPPIPPNIGRTLMEHVYVRLQRAITYDSRTVLSNNNIFNQILKAIEQNPTDEQLTNIMSSLPQNDDSAPNNLREAFYYATRNKKDAQNRLVEMNDEDEIEKREHAAMTLLHRISSSKIDYIKVIGQKALEQNDLGPICFIAPELGPFSKVGGLSTMVWELAKELVNLGLDIHVISPYYNVSPKGETDYLKKYGVEYIRTIDVYVPDQTKIGIHYAVVDGVKCWFLHHYSFFAAPYPTGSCSFRLQLLVVMAKAALELLCQVKIIPNLIVSNDWMTGLVPAMGRKQFGSIFNGTKFLHIFHNLGVGYAGKIWPNNGDTGSLRYIHQLPDELIVDNFDHSIDPSLCSLLCADQWATVSKKYRQELLEGSPYNWLLCRYPKPFAYSNGIRFQERLSALKKLNLTHLEAKRKVQQKYFGYVDDTKCLFVFVGRIVEQKGVYLIIDSFEELNRQYNGQLQFIVGGQAAPDDRAYGLPCTHRMWDLKNRYPKQFWADPSQFFSDGLLACQAADFTMIPSLFEPSGIVQQEAFASGCPVIAFKTGGLADTVFEFDREKHTGNGFVFLSHHHHDFIMAVQRAYDIFQNKELYEILRKRAFESTLSTETVAIAWSREFARLFMKIFEKKEVPAIESPKETKTETKVEAKAETKVETKAETKA